MSDANGMQSDDSHGENFHGFTLGPLVGDIGTPSDFEHQWGEVDFFQRVWESPTDSGHRVDLQVIVMRGERLCDIEAVVEFLAEYHEQRRDEWHLEDFAHPDGAGRRGDRFVFWLADPKVAVQVRDPFDTWGIEAVSTAACAIRKRDKS
ncbi:hypothetical protein [Natronoglycomyces albus]|uniref:Uncharacterized protein n=1 Tax=Natronoglycomyces albus TaxID=2811108 RepID=A0A895XGM7_9ACTN|nr:hypothetical protein [Natronoglycomyces albus]QSB04037.1 hypothetical protein JQS30_09405 [Natronoglycomyces albus]